MHSIQLQSRLLAVLLEGPLQQHRGAALAWLAVEAAPAAAFAFADDDVSEDSGPNEAGTGAEPQLPV